MAETRQELKDLYDEAENHIPSDLALDERVEEIMVAEVLGKTFFPLPEEVVVRDTDGLIWLVPETSGEDGEGHHGLVSRHNVRPGMKLRLLIYPHVTLETKAYPLTPERSSEHDEL